MDRQTKALLIAACTAAAIILSLVAYFRDCDTEHVTIGGAFVVGDRCR